MTQREQIKLNNVKINRIIWTESHETKHKRIEWIWKKQAKESTESSTEQESRTAKTKQMEQNSPKSNKSDQNKRVESNKSGWNQKKLNQTIKNRIKWTEQNWLNQYAQRWIKWRGTELNKTTQATNIQFKCTRTLNNGKRIKSQQKPKEKTKYIWIEKNLMNLNPFILRIVINGNLIDAEYNIIIIIFKSNKFKRLVIISNNTPGV